MKQKRDVDIIAMNDPKQKDLFSEDFSKLDWLGLVEDNDDPLHMGRCRVRVFEKFDDLPIDLIPWAFPATGTSVFAGGGGGYGAFSYPKVGHFVRVRFNGGDIMHPEYYCVENINKKLQGEIKSSYKNCQVISFDEDEDMKIIYTQSRGLLMFHKGSFVNIDADTHIHIVHDQLPSEMHFIDGDINTRSNDNINSESTKHYRHSFDTIIDESTNQITKAIAGIFEFSQTNTRVADKGIVDTTGAYMLTASNQIVHSSANNFTQANSLSYTNSNNKIIQSAPSIQHFGLSQGRFGVSITDSAASYTISSPYITLGPVGDLGTISGMSMNGLSLSTFDVFNLIDNYVPFKNGQTLGGVGLTSSIAKCEPLMNFLQALSITVDAKLTPTPGVTMALYRVLKVVECSIFASVVF